MGPSLRFEELVFRSFFVVILIGAAAACERQRAHVLIAGQLKGANVLLVTIDTLRQDRVGAYGNRNALTPTLDRLASQGIRFRRARAHVPMTLPSHASILTGLTPRRHGVRNNTTFRLSESVPTLATFFKRSGYRTAAFVGAFVLDARFGLARDFDVYDDRLPRSEALSFHFAERRAEDVLKPALAWIEGGAPSTQNPAPQNAPGTPHPAPRTQPEAIPWFAWIHLFDPHAPYAAPAEWQTGRTPYDAEIAYADAMLGRFLDRLAATGTLRNTLVIATADHGESLGEHGETTHGLFAYDSTISVPLIISSPAIEHGVIETPVAHIDIAPTVLELIGAPIPPDLDGRSLVQSPPADRPLYFEALDAYLTRGWAPLQGILQGNLKYIDLPDAELYDVASDPGELHNRFRSDGRADAMRRSLTALGDRSGATAAQVPVDGDAAARLRSLGYVGGSSTRPKSATSLADDPKRLVALNERFNSAVTASDSGGGPEALQDFLRILRERPDFLTARTSAATLLISARRPAEAAQLLRSAPPDQQTSPELRVKLAAALRDSGDLRGAASILEEARRAAKDSFDAQQDLAVIYASLGRSADARDLLRDLLTRNPSAASGWYNLGLVELQQRQPRAAATALRRAVDLDPSLGDAWNALGASLAKDDAAGAVDAWRHAERLLPRDYDLLFNLAMLTAEQGNKSDAVPYLRRFIAEAPRERYAADIANVERVLARLERSRE